MSCIHNLIANEIARSVTDGPANSDIVLSAFWRVSHVDPSLMPIHLTASTSGMPTCTKPQPESSPSSSGD